MDKTELAKQLNGFSFRLRQEACLAVEQPWDHPTCYLVWPISTEEHGNMLKAAKDQKAADVEAALEIASKYYDRLVWYANAAKDLPDCIALSKDAAAIWEDVARNLCPALDKAVVDLRKNENN